MVTILGAGSWGSALGVLLASGRHRVRMWDADRDVLRDIRANRRNSRYLREIELPESMDTADELPEALWDAAVVVVAIPAAGVADACARAGPHVPPGVTAISAAKGLCPTSGRRMSQVLSECAGIAPERVVALSGPNLALEVCAGIPTATVVSGPSRERMDEALRYFSGPRFRVYTNPDTVGVELGGAVKNVIAIGAGINDGLGFGDNTKATVLTRGLAEMTRLGTSLGARPETFRGLSGLGDLIATSVSPKSRNYRVGFGLGRGRSLPDVLAELGQVAEGVPTARAVLQVAAEQGVDVPICQAVHDVLFAGLDPREAVAGLMGRQPKDEIEECAVSLVNTRFARSGD